MSKNGKLRLSLKEENGGQVMVLSSTNRKGFFIGDTSFEGFVFVGSGFGHGVGLSQSGARGMAEAGFGYKRILMHYFKGTEIR